MTPYVIDSAGRRNYLFSFLTFVFASFVLGYVVGFMQGKATIDGDSFFSMLKMGAEQQQADVIEPDKASSESIEDSASLPAQAVAEKTTQAQKASTKKTLAQSKAKPAAKVTNKSANTGASTKRVKKPVKPPAKQALVKPKPKPKPKPTASLARTSPIKPITSRPIATRPATSKPIATTNKPVNSVATTSKPGVTGSLATQAGSQASGSSSATNVFGPSRPLSRYSVQAGLFVSKRNAQAMVLKLKNNGFDAYLNQFVSANGGTKYNVRFGYFADRPAVQQRLTEYKQLFTTPAYIVINK